MQNLASTLATAAIAVVALIHVYIVWLETLGFRSHGARAFGIKRDEAERMAVLFSNQGCYNGFLVAALALALLWPDAAVARAFAWYGLVCVAVAGVWGALSASRRILFVQTVPAVLAMALLALAG
jgi:putative membrane protein